ncbi:MAG TPA: hypothetical protein VMJ31_07235, partial [Methylocystis sp.]|nr:hypothetical protein [Methylocystis sp.]
MSEVTAEMIERGRGSDSRSAAARPRRSVKAPNRVGAARLPLVAYATLIPISCATLWIVLFHSSGEGSAATLAFIFVGAAQLFFVLLARRFHQLSFESVFYGSKKSELIAELEQAKANSDEARRR